MVTGAEPAFFYDWDGEHVAVPRAGLLERSRRLLRKTTVATRCPTTVLRRVCGLHLLNMMANSMGRIAPCLVGLYASLRGTSSLKRVGLHPPPRGWRSDPNCSRASRTAPRRHLVVRLRDSFGQADKARAREAAQCGQRRRVAREKRRWTHASRRRRTIRVLGAPGVGRMSSWTCTCATTPCQSTRRE